MISFIRPDTPDPAAQYQSEADITPEEKRSEVRRSMETAIAPVPNLHDRLRAIEAAVNASEVEPEEKFAGMFEQFRTIRARLLTLNPSPSVIVVTSPVVGDGKTLASINLAAALAAPKGEQVLLIDGDMRRPSVQRRLGIDARVGLQDVLRQQIRLEDAVVSAPRLGNLSVMPSGDALAQPAALLGTPRWNELIAQLRTRYSRIVIDTPPVHGLGDYPLIAQHADGVLMVCRIDHTPRAALAEAIRIAGSKLLGMVLNGLTEEFLCKTPGTRYYRQVQRSDIKP